MPGMTQRRVARGAMLAVAVLLAHRWRRRPAAAASEVVEAAARPPSRSARSFSER